MFNNKKVDSNFKEEFKDKATIDSTKLAIIKSLDADSKFIFSFSVLPEKDGERQAQGILFATNVSQRKVMVSLFAAMFDDVKEGERAELAHDITRYLAEAFCRVVAGKKK